MRSFTNRTLNSLNVRARCWAYAGAAIIGLSAVLDIAEPGDHILLVSFGSGAGSDAFDIQVTDAITERRDRAPKTGDYIARRTEIDYATYTRMRNKLVMK